MDTEKRFTIGFDAKRIVANATGLGNYGRTLVNALAQDGAPFDLVLYAPDAGRDDLRRQVAPSERLRFAYSGHRWRPLQDWWRAKGIVGDLVRDHVDLYHGLSGELPSGLREAGVKGVVTIHDLIFLRHPEYYNHFDVMLYRRKFLRSLREADAIVAISACTRRDILAFAPDAAGQSNDGWPSLAEIEHKTKVIYQSCGTSFRRPATDELKQATRLKYALPARYILNVGTIEERKNVQLAVMALEQLPQEVSLVIVGRRTEYANSVMEYVAMHGLADRVLTLDGVSNDELPAIYQQAEAFVYPSRYEGFGIPIIEAIQSGLPVVAATGSCLEEAGGPDCLYVDPDDAEGLAAALLRLLDTPQNAADRAARIARSREYVRRFENQDVAAQVEEVYRTLLD